MKPIVLTVHAVTVAAERGIETDWIERAVRTPQWREDDPATDGVERRYCELAERANRVLRVVCVESDTEIRVVTVFLDRRARRPA